MVEQEEKNAFAKAFERITSLEERVASLEQERDRFLGALSQVTAIFESNPVISSLMPKEFRKMIKDIKTNATKETARI